MPPNGKRGREHVLELLEGILDAEVPLERGERRADLRLERVDFDLARPRRAHPEVRGARSAGELVPRAGGEREQVGRQRVRLAEVVRRRCAPAVSTRSVTPLASARQAAGTVSVSVSRALRFGWSKQGKSAFASDGTSSVYRYVPPSFSSWNLMMLAPAGAMSAAKSRRDGVLSDADVGRRNAHMRAVELRRARPPVDDDVRQRRPAKVENHVARLDFDDEPHHDRSAGRVAVRD